MITLRMVGGPMDGRYQEVHDNETVFLPDPMDSERHYHRMTIGWGFQGLTFERELLVWDSLGGDDAITILMRKFVDLLDEHRL